MSQGNTALAAVISPLTQNGHYISPDTHDRKIKYRAHKNIGDMNLIPDVFRAVCSD